MSRNAPVITQCSIYSDQLKVAWKVDDFYPEPESPDLVNVVVNDYEYLKGKALPPSAHEIAIPLSELKLFGTRIVVEIQFVWQPAETLVSSVSMLIGQGEPDGPAHRESAPAPGLAIRDIAPKTLLGQNRMTLAYSSYDWTKGRIQWGARGGGKIVREIKPGGGIEADYGGTFTTDVPLLPQTEYEFVVSVTNGFQNITGTSSISVRSAPNYRSVRVFLHASGVANPGGLRASGIGSSVRAALGI